MPITLHPPPGAPPPDLAGKTLVVVRVRVCCLCGRVFGERGKEKRLKTGLKRPIPFPPPPLPQPAVAVGNVGQLAVSDDEEGDGFNLCF